MTEQKDREYALWAQFLKLFPFEKLKTMSLEEYSLVGSKDTFTWWVESGLDTLGSIWGSPAFKFGIYARKSNEKVFKGKQYKTDGQYAWVAKYGETREEAFSAIRFVIYEIAEAAAQGDLDRIEKANLSANYKWKIAYLYQNRVNPTVINIFNREVLTQFIAAKKGVVLAAKTPLSQLSREVMKLREGQDLLGFGTAVWTEGTILQVYTLLKKQFMPNFPGFSSFDNPTDAYLQEERNYKEELCSIYKKEIAPRLHPLPVSEDELLQLGKDITALFWRKLASNNNSPQNLVGWRYYDLAKGLDDTGQVTFAKAVSQLTDTSNGLDIRISDFINFLHRHSAKEKCGQAATRSLTSFFLFLSDPKTHFIIKTEEVNKLLKRFHLGTFSNDSLAYEEYVRVQRLAEEIYQLLKKDGLAPQDMIDVQSFMWAALHSPDTAKPPEVGKEAPNPAPPENVMTPYPLNQIFYGPPGTGKTYNTAKRAVQICDGGVSDDRPVLMERYRELIAAQRISFVSFHQSFSYEEFVEGIRPELSELADAEQEQLIYKIEDGLFKKICSMAQAAVDDIRRPQAVGIDLTGKKFYKMSVGGKYDPEVEAFCFENEYLALGWGGDVDFSSLAKEKQWVPARDAIKQRMIDQASEHADKKYAIQAIFWFKNYIDVGDIVVVAKGLNQVQAIGQVTGEYEYRPDLLPGEEYQHFRKVQWLVRDATIPVEKVWAKKFAQQSIYTLHPAHLNMDYLEKLLGGKEEKTEPTEVERYVLIIDEINRANISKVLGELITLIEPDKRLGQTNEVTVKLPYSKDEFGIPANLHIVGTMNTADRSLALMDTALRRRFEFEEMMPEYDLLAGVEVGGIKIDTLLETINQRIEALYDREHTIGHAFFMPLIEEPNIDHLASLFDHKIIPLLAEYFFEDWQKIRLVLGDNQKADRPEAQFILEEELENNGSALFGIATDLAMYGLDRSRQYQRNDKALTDPDAYIGIYDSAALKGE